jgi:hypothetical protein
VGLSWAPILPPGPGPSDYRQLREEGRFYVDKTAWIAELPERVYHAFVLGLLAHLEPEYRVRSERESGYGRSDVLIIPGRPGRAGVVLELKRVLEDQGESPEDALASALRQIEDRDYAAELRVAGADAVRKVAIAFAGKRVWVLCA